MGQVQGAVQPSQQHVCQPGPAGVSLPSEEVPLAFYPQSKWRVVCRWKLIYIYIFDVRNWIEPWKGLIIVTCLFFVFQVIEFGELDKPTVRFLRQLLSKLLKETDPEDLVSIFGRWASLRIHLFILDVKH